MRPRSSSPGTSERKTGLTLPVKQRLTFSVGLEGGGKSYEYEDPLRPTGIMRGESLTMHAAVPVKVTGGESLAFIGDC